MMEFDLEEFKRKYPHLSKELEEGIGVEKLSSLISTSEPPAMPGAVDYLRRCKSVQEALEVLDYLERTGELSKEHRQLLEAQLLSEGLESFGPKKDFGYYSEKYLKNINLKALQRRLP